MNCPAARRQLEQGVRPGSSPPERAALGFHLAGCADCRAYRTQMDSQLLSRLLAADQTMPQSSVPTLIEPATDGMPAARTWRESLSQAIWYGSLGLLAAFLLAVVIVVVSAALSIFNIHQNVQAMIVPTAGAEISHPTGAPAVQAAPVATVLIEPTLALVPTPLPPTGTPPVPSVTPIPTALPPTPTPPAPPAGGPITVLMLGSDERPGETDPSRTDAIIIARIDPHSGRVALLSLPRDLWVEIPGYGYARLNAANVWGIIYNAPEGGLGLAQKTVSNLLGIPIDYTIHINFQGFIGAIDALGGITIDVPKELYDDEFPTMDYGYTVAHFLPGSQQMDGATALMYSRIRHPDSDFERMRRQQAVVVGAMARIREQNPLQSLKSLEDVTAALRAYVQTDLPEDRMIGLAWALRNFSPDHVERYLLDEENVSFGIGDDRWAEVADPNAIEALARKLIGQ